MKPCDSLKCSQEPATGPCPETKPVHILTGWFFNLHFNIILPSRSLYLIFKFLRLTLCINFSSLPCVLHALPIFISSISLPKQYFFKCSNHILSSNIFLLLPLSQVKNSLQRPSQTLSSVLHHYSDKSSSINNNDD